MHTNTQAPVKHMDISGDHVYNLVDRKIRGRGWEPESDGSVTLPYAQAYGEPQQRLGTHQKSPWNILFLGTL